MKGFGNNDKNNEKLRERKVNTNNHGRTLSDDYKNIEIKRNHIYNSLADYIYYNDGFLSEFNIWLNLIMTKTPFGLNSTFLCKTEESYETNISNCIENYKGQKQNYYYSP